MMQTVINWFAAKKINVLEQKEQEMVRPKQYNKVNRCNKGSAPRAADAPERKKTKDYTILRSI